MPATLQKQVTLPETSNNNVPIETQRNSETEKPQNTFTEFRGTEAGGTGTGIGNCR